MTEMPAIDPDKKRKKKKSLLQQRAEYAAYRAAVAAASTMSDATVIAWGRRVGLLASRVLSSRSRLAMRNIQTTFPEKTEAECRRVLDLCWSHFGRVILEYLRLQRMPKDKVLARCEIAGREHLDRALALDRGVLLISGHFGTWEIGAFVLGSIAPRATTVARPLDNDLLEADLMGSRTRAGLEIVDRRRAARPLVRALERKASIVLLPDQAVQPREGIIAPFLGRDGWTTPAPARLALRFGAPIVFVFCVPSGGANRLEFEEPIYMDDLTGSHRTAEGLTALINERISRRIREHPELWLWMHDRWKNTV